MSETPYAYTNQHGIPVFHALPGCRVHIEFPSKAHGNPSFIHAELEYAVARLLAGEEAAQSSFHRYGLTIVIEPSHDDAVCNLYRVRSSAAEIAGLYAATVASEFEWRSEIYPRYVAPVVIAHEGKRRLGPMKWGFPTEVAGKTKMLPKHVTNCRNLDSPFWRASANKPNRRCLVPFTQFAEPRLGKDETGRPAQWWFTINDQATASFAGLWRPTEDGPVFSFLTCEPNPLVAPLHPKAMPVILHAEDHDRWLYGSIEDVRELQAPYPSQLMGVE